MNKRFSNQQPIWNSPLVREDVIDISGEQRNFINQIIVSTINCDYIRGKAKSVYSHSWEGFIVLPLSIEFLSIFGCHLQSCKLFQELHMYIFQLQLSSAMARFTFCVSSSLVWHVPGLSFHMSLAENFQRPQKLLPPVEK